MRKHRIGPKGPYAVWRSAEDDKNASRFGAVNGPDGVWHKLVRALPPMPDRLWCGEYGGNSDLYNANCRQFLDAFPQSHCGQLDFRYFAIHIPANGQPCRSCRRLIDRKEEG